jgi:ABC-type transport system substrate-binding protein/serine/threonine protein kinase
MIETTLQDRYVLTGELGRGGMGVVYRAHDPVLDREVAVKLIPPTHVSAETEERFRREAQIVAQMDHPGIVPIYDFGRHEDSLYLVMPVVQGASLRPLLEGNSLRVGDVVDIGIAMAQALEHSHSMGVVHRDIKPENVMVAREESGGVRVRVMDFGLARVAASNLTQTGVVVGTIGYVSPEQITSQAVDHRCDIYALGTVLYECLTGRPPFSGEMQSTLYRIVHEMPEAPSAQGLDIDEEFEHTVLRCLAKKPSDRPQRAGDVAHALRRVQNRMRDDDRHKSVVLRAPGGTPRQRAAPFVGREQELGGLQQRLNAAIHGECQFVVVGGEPGSGKIQEYFRQKEAGSSSSSLTDFSDLAPDLVALFPMLAEIEDIRNSSSTNSRISEPVAATPENKTQVFELLARAFIRIAGGKPLVLLLEDLHGADASIEALQYMIPRLGPTPTLVVGTYRTTDVDRHHPLSQMLHALEGDRRFESLTLGSFTPSEHRLFLETLVGAPDIADDLVNRLFERTEGNPFFTKELVRSLLESEAIGKDETGTWALTGSARIRSGALPVTIQQAVEKRVQRLPAELRDVLSVAAVIGKTFDFREFEELAASKGDVDDAIDQLVSEGLLEEVPGVRSDMLTFASSMVRDVLYAELSRRKRRSLHRKCASQIERRHAGRLERVYPELLFHYSEGDVPEKSVEYGLALTRVSLKSFSPEEAIRAAKVALEFLDEDWEGDHALEAEARLLLARAQRMAGDIDAALIEAGRSGQVYSEEGHAGRAAKALLFAAETAWQARRPEETSALVERGLQAARAVSDTESLTGLLSLGATLANLRGQYEAANQLLHEAEEFSGGEEIEPEETVPQGGRLIVPLSMPVEARTPWTYQLDDEVEVLSNVFETLLTTDEDSHLVPGLCESWDVMDKGRSMHLRLRKDVLFHDGHAMTAADVKRSIEQSAHQSAEVPAATSAILGFADFKAGNSSTLEGIAVRSEHELEIWLTEPLPSFPAMLTDVSTAVVRELSDGRVVGTGPFRMALHEPERVVLERNDRYRMGTVAPLETVEFRPYMSPPAIAAGIRSGELDLARDLTSEDLNAVVRDPRFRHSIVETPKKNVYFILFNSRNGILAERPDLRHLLAAAVRRTELVWQTLGRFSQPASCFLPPGIMGHDAGKGQPSAGPTARDPGPDGPDRLRVAVHPVVKDRCSELLDVLFSDWARVGVELVVATDSMGEFLQAAESGEDIDILFTRWNADYYDPDSFAFNLFDATDGRLRHWMESPRAAGLLQRARVEADPAEREQAYRQWDASLQEEALLVPVFHDIDYRIASPRVRGLRLRPMAPYVNYAELGKASAADSSMSLRIGPVGKVAVPMANDVMTLESSKWRSGEEAEVAGCVFETLVRQVEGARVVPALASSFRVEEGGSKYRFQLRKGVRFHDGRPVTARDVRYSFERMLQKGFGALSPILGAERFMAGEVAHLPGFHIHSTHEFTVALKQPVAFFPVLVCHNAAAILPEGTEKLGTSWEEGCIGTGPFRVVRFEPGRTLEMERNPHYWRPGTPKVEGVVFSFNVPRKDILEGFKSGRFSLCTDLIPDDLQQLYLDPEYASGYQEAPDLSTYFVAFNRNTNLMQDVRNRRRLRDAVDVPVAVRQTLGRLAIPANGVIPPGLLGHDSRFQLPAGGPVSDDLPLELTAAVHPLFQGEYSALFDQVMRSFERVGVTGTCVNENMQEFLNEINAARVDMVVGRWVGDYPDADSFMHAFDLRAGFLSVGPMTSTGASAPAVRSSIRPTGTPSTAGSRRRSPTRRCCCRSSTARSTVSRGPRSKACP